MAVINGRGTWGVRSLIPNVVSSSSSSWTRPSDWLALNGATGSTEQFTGLLAITNDDSNYVTLFIQGCSYTVDWGDGTTTTHANNTVAEHKYEYSAISDSTLTSRGYKQVVVRATAIISSIYDALSLFATNKPHSTLILSGATNVLYTWLEFHLNMPKCPNLAFHYATYGPTGGRSTWLEKVTLNKLAANATLGQVFSDLYSLQEVAINYATTGLTSTIQMFYNCYNLKKVSLFDTSAVTVTSNMFTNCYSLTTIPSLNLASVDATNSMFAQCYSLTTVPDLNLSNATNLSSMFVGCNSLVTAPTLTTTKVTNTSLMFSGCGSLETIPLFNTSTVTNPYGMFYYCGSLATIPTFDFSQTTNFANIFESCTSLKKIPLLDTQRVTNWTNAFVNCHSLDELPAFNLTATTTITGMFTYTNGIAKAPFVNIRNTFTFGTQMLSRTAIVDIFNGLASGVTGSKIITVSGNPGYASLTAGDRLIATAKGWTIA